MSRLSRETITLPRADVGFTRVVPTAGPARGLAVLVHLSLIHI